MLFLYQMEFFPLIRNQIINDVTSMHINDDHSLDSDADTWSQITSNKLYNVFNLIVKNLDEWLKTIFFTDSLLDILGPVNLIDGEHNLTRPVFNPISSLDLVVLSKWLLGKFS